jgi:septal ring factor EnvC (AmiA/AmiB activator)
MNMVRIAALFATVLTAGGCWEQEPAVRMTAPARTIPARPSAAAAAPAKPPEAAPTAQAHYLAPATLKDEGGRELPNATDSAVEWSIKYAQTSEKLLAGQRENQELADKNRALASQIVKFQADLDNSQKHIKEAEAMMLELRGELDKWKTNVLGFRQEMRDAQQAQLEALQKILRLLGGETQPRLGTTSGPTVPMAKETSRAPTD